MARAEIEQTRAEMSATVDAIKEKVETMKTNLEPHHLMEQAKETARDATLEKLHQAEQTFDKAMETMKATAQTAVEKARDMGEMAADRAKVMVNKTVDTAKKNPVQTTLIGLGVLTGWS